ncbi:MAG: tail fiber domain-containing protein [Saprospiraceae bacterium]|nr:tail fiber domain-containing protein [Saprospiraceae bacterium]
MKNIICFLFLSLPIYLFGQNGLPYQAVLKDAQGAPIINTQILLRFTIENNDNVIRYQETQSPTTDQFGWFQVIIGTGVPSIGAFGNIDWNEANTLIMECQNSGQFEVVSSQPILGSPFTFNGDNNPANDITVGTPAGGDLSATYPNPKVKAIQGFEVSENTPNVGEVLKWNGSQWSPAIDISSTTGGASGVNSIISGPGIEVNNADPKNPIIINKGDVSNSNELQTLSINGTELSISSGNSVTLPSGDGWGTQVVGHNATLSGDGTTNNPLQIAQQGATNGKVLKWNNVSWTPMDDLGFDNWGTQVVQKDATLSGDGTAGSPLMLAPQGASNGQVLKFNATANTWTPSNDNGADNWGTQVVQKDLTLTGDGTTGSPLKLAPQGATNGQVLKYNTSSNTWIPSNDNGADNWGTQVVQKDLTLTGDGTTGSPLKLAPQGATNGQVLKYNTSSNTWIPSNDNGADNWGTQVVQKDLTLTGDGTTGSPLKLAPQGATNGQVLKYNTSSNTWIPSNDNGADNWGTQVVQKDASLMGDGTTGSPLKLAAQGATGGQILVFNSQTSQWTPGYDGWGSQTVLTDGTLMGNGTTGNPLKIATQGAVTGQVLTYNASVNSWKPETPSSSKWTQSGNNIYFNAGNVGIGTTAPTSKLVVDGSIVPETNNTGDLGSSSLLWGKTYTSALHLGTNIIIATTPSGATINEDFRPSDAASYNLGGSALRWNNIYSQNPLNTPSDIRLKKDIKVLKYGLSDILKLEPKSYSFKNDAQNKVHFGLIAQHTKKIIPEVVQGDEEKENLSMAYESLIPVLINAIKEQQQTIDDLQLKNEDLYEKNAKQIQAFHEMKASNETLLKEFKSLKQLYLSNKAIADK